MINTISQIPQCTIIYSSVPFLANVCTCLHISATKWCIVRYFSDELWGLWECSIDECIFHISDEKWFLCIGCSECGLNGQNLFHWNVFYHLVSQFLKDMSVSHPLIPGISEYSLCHKDWNLLIEFVIYASLLQQSGRSPKLVALFLLQKFVAIWYGFLICTIQSKWYQIIQESTIIKII